MFLVILDRRAARWVSWALALTGTAAVLLGCERGAQTRVAQVYHWKRDPTPQNLQRIRACLDDENRDVRVTALYALVAASVPDTRELVVRAIEDEDGFVRATAAKCLGDLEHREAIPILVKHLLSDEDWHVRQRAGESLAVLGGEASREALARALADPVKEVRLVAVKGLADLDPLPSLDALARIVVLDPEWEIRVHAARALGLTRRPETLEALEAARRDPNEFVRAAAWKARREIVSTRGGD